MPTKEELKAFFSKKCDQFFDLQFVNESCNLNAQDCYDGAYRVYQRLLAPAMGGQETLMLYQIKYILAERFAFDRQKLGKAGPLELWYNSLTKEEVTRYELACQAKLPDYFHVGHDVKEIKAEDVYKNGGLYKDAVMGRILEEEANRIRPIEDAKQPEEPWKDLEDEELENFTENFWAKRDHMWNAFRNCRKGGTLFLFEYYLSMHAFDNIIETPESLLEDPDSEKELMTCIIRDRILQDRMLSGGKPGEFELWCINSFSTQKEYLMYINECFRLMQLKDLTLEQVFRQNGFYDRATMAGPMEQAKAVVLGAGKKKAEVPPKLISEPVYAEDIELASNDGKKNLTYHQIDYMLELIKRPEVTGDPELTRLVKELYACDDYGRKLSSQELPTAAKNLADHLKTEKGKAALAKAARVADPNLPHDLRILSGASAELFIKLAEVDILMTVSAMRPDVPPEILSEEQLRELEEKADLMPLPQPEEQLQKKEEPEKEQPEEQPEPSGSEQKEEVEHGGDILAAEKNAPMQQDEDRPDVIYPDELEKRLDANDGADAPGLLNGYISHGRGFRMHAGTDEQAEDYYLWNKEQNGIVHVKHHTEGGYDVESSGGERMDLDIRNEFTKDHSGEIKGLTDQKEPLNLWDRFVNFFGFKTERIRRNERIDRAIKLKTDAYVRDTLTKAGFTNEEFLPPEPKTADKQLAELNWNELAQYVQSGKAPEKKKENKIKVENEGGPRYGKMDRTAREKELAKTLLRSVGKNGLLRLADLIDRDTEMESTRDLVDVLSKIQMQLDPPENGTIEKMDDELAKRFRIDLQTADDMIPQGEENLKMFARDMKNLIPGFKKLYEENVANKKQGGNVLGS